MQASHNAVTLVRAQLHEVISACIEMGTLAEGAAGAVCRCARLLLGREVRAARPKAEF
jgi:hypothetical protein